MLIFARSQVGFRDAVCYLKLALWMCLFDFFHDICRRRQWHSIWDELLGVLPTKTYTKNLQSKMSKRNIYTKFSILWSRYKLRHSLPLQNYSNELIYLSLGLGVSRLPCAKRIFGGNVFIMQIWKRIDWFVAGSKSSMERVRWDSLILNRKFPYEHATSATNIPNVNESQCIRKWF